MKRVENTTVPVIDFLVNYHQPDFDDLVNDSHVKKNMFEQLVKAITRGISKKTKSVKLFCIQGSGNILYLPKSGWNESLNLAMNYYSSTEDYTSAIHCRDLLVKIA